MTYTHVLFKIIWSCMIVYNWRAESITLLWQFFCVGPSLDAYDIMFSNSGHLESAILDFLIFAKPSKSTKTDQEMIKINKKNNMQMIYKCKRKLHQSDCHNFSFKRGKLKILKKCLSISGCHGNFKLDEQGFALSHCSQTNCM